eukprot:2566439-Ditylum_brightwellii.AAC.1
MVHRKSQAVHTGLQHEWAYLQWVIDVNADQYAVLYNIIQKELIPALFDADNIPNKFDQLFTLLVKHTEIGVLSPKVESALNCQTSIESTQHLVGAILQDHDLNLQDHDQMMTQGKIEG